MSADDRPVSDPTGHVEQLNLVGVLDRQCPGGLARRRRRDPHLQLPQAATVAISTAMSMIMSSWPPTRPSSPQRRKMSFAGTPYRAAACSACNKKLEYTPAQP